MRIVIAVLLAATAAGAETPSSWIKVKGGAWEPNETSLSHLQADIQKYVASQASQHGAELRPWGEYRFQYQGRHDGKALAIFVNAFCHSSRNENLDTDFIVVLDGGACFFNLVYEPERRRFLGLRFNGRG